LRSSGSCQGCCDSAHSWYMWIYWEFRKKSCSWNKLTLQRKEVNQQQIQKDVWP
jgi:hypothetical protein